MNTPLFSVVVSTYNRPEFLRTALASVESQTVDDFECIVVNDGEVDAELPDDPRFTLLDKREGGGMASALNSGVREARGKYLTFLDDDDAYTRRRLELGLNGVEQAPIGICWRENYDTGVAGKNRMLNGWVHDEILDRSPPMLGQVTIERDRMLPLEERLRHPTDVEWWIRATATLPVATIPEVGLRLRRHSSRISSDAAMRFEGRSLMYSLHRDYFETHRRAAARFHKRTGLFARDAGLSKEARAHLWQALRFSPGPRNGYWLARSLFRR